MDTKNSLPKFPVCTVTMRAGSDSILGLVVNTSGFVKEESYLFSASIPIPDHVSSMPEHFAVR